MIIDIRYHIITLVAVFLMLGLGILIGTTMVGSETITKQQELLADRLEKQLNALRLENQKVQERCERIEEENATLQLFAREVVPFAIAGRLQNLRVALFELGGAASPELLNDLKTAGALVGPVITILSDFDVSAMAPEISKDLGWPGKGPEEVRTRLAQELGRAVATGENPRLVEYLVERQLLKVVGDYSQPAQRAVIVGSLAEAETGHTGRVDLALIDGLIAEGVGGIVVVTKEGSGKNIKEYQQRKISTVEDGETPWGRIGLILALAGQPGHYGSTGGAKHLLPPFPPGGA